MQRVAALYDIHGNLPALEAVLEDMRRSGVEHLIVGGDVVPGPMSRAVIERLLALEIPSQCITGNGESAVLKQMTGRQLDEIPEQARPAVAWEAQQLGAEHQRLFAEWPATLRVHIDGLGDVLFCHATPRNDSEIFTRTTPESAVAPAFAGVDASLVVCGHTHMPFDRPIGRLRVVNAGSVGMPFGAPGADWLLLGPGVEFRHTTYDLDKAASRIAQTGYPDAEGFAARYVLNPPGEAEMLELFNRVAIGPSSPRASTGAAGA